MNCRDALTGLTGVIVACLPAMTVRSVWTQDASAGGTHFEAATVKPHTTASPDTGRSGIEETPGLIRIENLSLKAIIEAAFGVKDFQFAGPGWLDAVSFDIVAKPPAGYDHKQLQALLRDLLADRFKLAVHHESKETPGFALVAAKGGPKLQEATKPRGFLTVRPGLIAGTRVSIAQLTSALARMLGRPVVDDTGLTAEYEVKLEWTPDQAPPTVSTDRKDTSLETGPSLFAALEPLGLRLQTTKVPVDAVIVDHVEKIPTEN